MEALQNPHERVRMSLSTKLEKLFLATFVGTAGQLFVAKLRAWSGLAYYLRPQTIKTVTIFV